MRVIDAAGHLVQMETVPRACRGCGTVVTVRTNVFGRATIPDHDKDGPAIWPTP